MLAPLKGRFFAGGRMNKVLFFFLFLSASLTAKAPKEIFRQNFYLFPCPVYGIGSPGMFSVFCSVLGFLETYGEKQEIGYAIDFEKKGLYYQQDKGPNWWEYYFEPLVKGNRKGSREHLISVQEQHSWGLKTRTMSRERAAALIAKHIRIKEPIRRKLDAFIEENFRGFTVIGIHYRGTDKNTEAPRVPYERIFEEIDRVTEQCAAEPYKLFIATDEKQFLDASIKRYGNRVIFLPAIRSLDGSPVHTARGRGYQKGEEALLDCLLLAHTDILIRTLSNLSLISLFFNPELPELLIQ